MVNAQQIDRLMQNELELDLLLATESGMLQDQIHIYQSERNREGSVSVYRESLYGVDAEHGREIFYQNAAAQCIRCHAVNGNESDVVTELTEAGSRLSRSELLRSMGRTQCQNLARIRHGIPDVKRRRNHTGNVE